MSFAAGMLRLGGWAKAMTTGRGQQSDEELMAAFRASGDPRIFEELAERHTARVLAAARVILKDETAAEDAAQEAFLRLIRARNSYTPGKRFQAWFFAILRNVCRDELCRRARAPLPNAPEHPSAGNADPSHRAEVRESAERAQAALAVLTSEDREILMLRIHGNLDFSEIAAHCGLSTEAAKKRAYRALEQVRQQMAADAGNVKKNCPEPRIGT